MSEQSIQSEPLSATTAISAKTKSPEKSPEFLMMKVKKKGKGKEKICGPGKVLNEKTGRCVKENKIPKKIHPIISPEDHNQDQVKNVVGLTLKYPNPITERLEKRMPQLFVKSKNDKMKAYIRMCPLAMGDRRQPIILTKEEKEDMVKENPGAYNEKSDFVEYGADEKKDKYYFTCPKYWCLLTDKVVTEKDILEGKCGPKVNKIEDAIIPKDAEEVPEGKYVYQFYDEDKKMYPGFHKDNVSSGICAPCCYAKWNTEKIKERRDICQGTNKDNDKDKDNNNKENQIEKDIAKIEKYIKGPEKYGPRLGEQRWGWLPVSIQFFFNQMSSTCQISQTNPDLKPGHACLLRFGVEDHPTQSFIACIASVLHYTTREIPSIKQMKETIIRSLTIDRFVKYQNGDLIATFANPNIPVKEEEFNTSKLYQKIKEMDANGKANAELFLVKVVQSMEHFKAYLRNDEIKIDPTYLWDIICMPNPQLFSQGTNLIILEIPENDVTNNVELVCPSNHYSDYMYDKRKQSIVLIKRENYYEPVYLRTDGNPIMINKTFSESDKDIPQGIRSIFADVIGPTLLNKCKPLASMREVQLKQPPPLTSLISELTKRKYAINKQVLNYQGKTIGLLCSKNKLNGYVPCLPSAMLEEMDFVYMDADIWSTYANTMKFLTEYYKTTKEFRKVVNGEKHVIGFLTSTDHFIPIRDPTPISHISDVLESVEHDNLLVADAEILTSNQVDDERVKYIKRIQLETHFYNVFRNTIRQLLNQPKHFKRREQLKTICDARGGMYTAKLKKVIEMLHLLTDEHIIFAARKSFAEIDEANIYSCLSKKDDECGQSGSVCQKSGKNCQLVLPKTNLVNQMDNEEYYFNRMGDELIRYNRVRSFIFKPQKYLSFGNVKYNLREDEIILLHDNITQEYFEKLIPAEINQYAKYNTYNTANPNKTIAYDNRLEKENEVEKEEESPKFLILKVKKPKINKKQTTRKKIS
jgi:hypothetical protein